MVRRARRAARANKRLNAAGILVLWGPPAIRMQRLSRVLARTLEGKFDAAAFLVLFHTFNLDEQDLLTRALCMQAHQRLLSEPQDANAWRALWLSQLVAQRSASQEVWTQC